MKATGGGVAGALATEGARRATGVASAAAAEGRRPDPEVPAKAQRRRFTPEYKLRIVEEADACREPGELGALLRREGLYSSHLSTWREQQRAGALVGLVRTRGRKAKQSVVEKRLAEAERENTRLREELRKAHVIIDVQKNGPGGQAPTCWTRNSGRGTRGLGPEERPTTFWSMRAR